MVLCIAPNCTQLRANLRMHVYVRFGSLLLGCNCTLEVLLDVGSLGGTCPSAP